MTTAGVEKLVRRAAWLEAREREHVKLEARFAALTEAYATLGAEMDALHQKHARLRTVAVDLAARLATMGAVVAHDDVARILDRALAEGCSNA